MPDRPAQENSATIPQPALTCREIRAIDAFAIEQLGIPGIVLMENAARSVAEFVYSQLADPSRDRVVILCGPGNNGGDGFAVARHLHIAGASPTCVLTAAPDRIRGDAAVNLRIVERMKLPLLIAADAEISPQVREGVAAADVIIDALLGTGSSGPPRGQIAELIRLANARPRARRIAVDVPSGLDADSGAVHDPCFRASATVTFVAEKIGFAVPAARAVLGEVIVVGIGAPVGETLPTLLTHSPSHAILSETAAPTQIRRHERPPT